MTYKASIVCNFSHPCRMLLDHWLRYFL